MALATISTGSALARAALAGLVQAASEIRDRGSFGFAGEALPFAEANGFMASCHDKDDCRAIRRLHDGL
jgi:hypothetical protein